MFLQALLRRNRAFLEAAVTLHRAGEIPANSYVLDLDAVAANSVAFCEEAHRRGLTVLAMTKQVGRAPGALDAMARGGADGFVAVDMACARAIVANGHRLGHLGHLVQVPRAEAREAAALRPDFWTVFSAGKASEAAGAAVALDRTQNLLVRVCAAGDEFYPGHEGGVPLDELGAFIDRLGALAGARFAGLTTFPALLFDPDTGGARTTRNVQTLARAAELARRRLGPDATVAINAPGTTSIAVLDQLADAGATQVEPGHGLTGTTPLHATADLPERPAICYLSEVSHLHGGAPLCFGGGFYIDPVFEPYSPRALLAADPDRPRRAARGDGLPRSRGHRLLRPPVPAAGPAGRRGRHRDLRVPGAGVRHPGRRRGDQRRGGGHPGGCGLLGHPRPAPAAGDPMRWTPDEYRPPPRSASSMSVGGSDDPGTRRVPGSDARGIR